MMKHRKSGRPKLPENQRKKRFSVTLHPALIDRIETHVTDIKGRNALIEETLEKNF